MARKISFILAICIHGIWLPALVQGQAPASYVKDSLNTVLNNAAADTAKLKILLQAIAKRDYADTAFALQLLNKYNSLAHKTGSKYDVVQSGYYLGKYWQYCRKNIPAALKNYENCAAVAIEYDDNDMAIRAFIEMAQACEYINNNTMALENYYKALNLRPPPDVCQGIYGNMGQLYNTLGDYARAFYYYEQAYVIKSRQMVSQGKSTRDDTLVLMLLQVNIANTHIAMQQYKAATENFGSVQALNKDIKNDLMAIYSLQGIGRCLQISNALTASITYFTKALQISTAIKDDAGQCNLLNNIGNAYLKLGDARAGQYAAKALAIETAGSASTFSNISQYLPDTYVLLANIAAKKKEFRQALDTMSMAINLYAQARRQHDESEAWGDLSDIYQQMGNPAGALSAYKRQVNLRDSVFSQEKAREITRIEMTGEFDRRRIADSMVQAKKDIQDKAELQAQKKNSYFFMAGSILAMLVAAGALYFLAYTRRAKAQIELLMREMHHRVKNNLQVISTLLNLQLASIPDEHAKRSIEEGITRIGSIALIHHHLHQKDGLTSIEIAGFARELLKQVFAIYSKAGQQLEEYFEIPATRLDIDTAIPLGLMLNELMTNSFKYAYQNTPTCRLAIKLLKEEDRYIVEYRDYGPGLPLDFKAETSSSLGMQLIHNLSGQLAGSFYYNRAAGCFIVTFRDTAVRRKTA